MDTGNSTPLESRELPESAQKALNTPGPESRAKDTLAASKQSPLADVTAPKEALADNTITKPTATELLEQGHALFAKEDYAQASDLYSQAVEALTTQYGELSIETVDALIAYGKCLLRHAVASSGVFGGGSAQSTSQAQEGNLPVAGPSSTKLPAQLPVLPSDISTAKKSNFHFGGDAEELEENAEEANTGNPDETVDQSQVQPDVDDDLGDAFEILDMARTILSKLPDIDKESTLKLADVHASLGEVATESEKFVDAAAEYTSSLEILQAVLENHNRKIAEMHLMAALSYENIPQTAAEITSESGEAARLKAVYHAEQSKQILLSRRNFIVQSEEEAGRKTNADYIKDASLELQDIAEVLEELELKIEDLKQMPEIAQQTEKDKALDQALGASSFTPDAPVNNLSSLGLVKKKKQPSPLSQSTAIPDNALNEINGTNGTSVSEKRKAEEPTEEVGSVPKKVKLDT